MDVRLQLGIVLTAFVVMPGSILAQAITYGNYTHRELKKMAHEAHTTEQYETLASYYRFRQQKFQQEARGEFAEWIRRWRMGTTFASKYPRPEDSSKYRYEYFSYEAQEMGDKADQYEKLAAGAKQ